MPESKLSLSVHNGAHPGHKVMVLAGDLNAQTAFDFRDHIRGNEADTLVLDMSRVRYVDSTGLGAIVGAYVSYDRNCRHFLLAGTTDRVWDLIRTCKLTDVFTRYASVEDAERFDAAPA